MATRNLSARAKQARGRQAGPETGCGQEQAGKSQEQSPYTKTGFTKQSGKRLGKEGWYICRGANEGVGNRCAGE